MLNIFGLANALSLPTMEAYSLNPLLTLTLALTPLALFFFNSLTYRVRVALLCLILPLVQSLHRAGGDLFNYTIAINTSTIWNIEPFWFIFFLLHKIYHVNNEFLISFLYFIISLLFFGSILSFYNGHNIKDIFYGLLLASVMFGPALYQAQIRLSLSIAFTYLSIFLFKKRKSVIATLLMLSSVISHSTSILFSPLIIYLAFSDNVDDYLTLLIQKSRVKFIFLMVLILLVSCVIVVLVVLAPRYFSADSSQFQLGQASGSFLYDLISSFTIFILYKFSLNSNFVFQFASSSKYIRSQFFNSIISSSILLGFIGWLGRFKFWFYPYISLTISSNYKPFIFFILALFTLRNLRLYFLVDPSYMVFLF
ncbi:hypothetical protein [Synechococcus sp. RS9916]|uniref:hypothetical protein n=1 Tax=Synechococcus sp. RS9916 TaxID=221359 RepID=UPI000315C859|nr:hypothetical protein [Synechococcus sp. RS9916]